MSDSETLIRKGGSICTSTGIIFYPLDPRVEEICLEDVAHALSHKARFTGHTKKLYSTGEHSVRVSWLLKDQGRSLMDQFVGLHHDDSDAYLPDVPTPLKVLPEFDWFRELEHKIQNLCYEKFGCVVTDYKPIKSADISLFLTERRDLMPTIAGGFSKRYVEEAIPYPYTITPWNPVDVKSMYLRTHMELLNAISQSV